MCACLRADVGLILSCIVGSVISMAFYRTRPCVVQVHDVRQSLLHFIVRICAVVGGVLTLCGRVDKVVHSLLSGTLDASSRPSTARPGAWNKR